MRNWENIGNIVFGTEQQLMLTEAKLEPSPTFKIAFFSETVNRFDSLFIFATSSKLET